MGSIAVSSNNRILVADVGGTHARFAVVEPSAGVGPWRVHHRLDLTDRQRFEDKGRLTAYVAAIPTRLIVNPDLALLGAGRAGLVLAPAAVTQALSSAVRPDARLGQVLTDSLWQHGGSMNFRRAQALSMCDMTSEASTDE
jgi:Glucokinase